MLAKRVEEPDSNFLLRLMVTESYTYLALSFDAFSLKVNLILLYFELEFPLVVATFVDFVDKLGGLIVASGIR